MKATDFLTKNKRILESIEANDSEISADKVKSKELDKQNDNYVEPSPTIDTDDDQILAVMNNYFRHINEIEDGEKVGMMGNLIHRMVNKMIEMPGGEKALRAALKGAVNGLPSGDKFEAMKKKPKNENGDMMAAKQKKSKNESLLENMNKSQIQQLGRETKQFIADLKKAQSDFKHGSSEYSEYQDQISVAEDFFKIVSDYIDNLS